MQMQQVPTTNCCTWLERDGHVIMSTLRAHGCLRTVQSSLVIQMSNIHVFAALGLSA